MSVRRLLLAIVVSLLPSLALAQDPGDMVLRIGRLENQLREMAGQIEQLQHENRRLGEQVRKFQEDVEFRFQERGGKRAQGQAATTPNAQHGAALPQQSSRQQQSPQQPPGQAQPLQQQAAGSERPSRNDAFDPAANPNAPGAPRQLGSQQSALAGSALPAGVPKGALDGEAGRDDRLSGADAREDAGPARPLDLAPRDRSSAAPSQSRAGPSIAATGTGDPRKDYEAAYASMMQSQYDQAEMGFRAFLQSHPRDDLVPDATYWLGESFYQRGRYREAAQQFLKVTTDYQTTAKASQGLLKLGMALAGMGEREQACGTFTKVLREHPSMREAVEREKRRAKC